MIPFNTQTMLLRQSAELFYWLRHLNQGLVDIVIDESVFEQEATLKHLGIITTLVQDTRVVTYRGKGCFSLRPSSFVVAIGGGTVLDDVKLRAYFDAFPTEMPRHLARRGMVILPELPERPHIVAAIPTTLGTGSEASQVAILRGHGKRQLLLGDGLAPALAFHSPEFLEGLPGTLLSEGVLEILARLIGPYIGSRASSNVEDATVRAYVSYMAPVLTNPELLVETVWKSDLLRIGARAHQAGVTGGRSPYGVKWWPIVNEICALTGDRKIPVLASVLPQIFARILAGDNRWGSSTQLYAIWKAIAFNAQGDLSHDPVVGLQELFSLHVPRADLSGIDTETLAHHVMRTWGGGSPMFQGFEYQDIANLLQDTIVSRHG